MHDLVVDGRVLSDSEAEIAQIFQAFEYPKAPITSLKMAAGSGNTQPGSLSISSFPTIGTNPPSPCLNSVDCNTSSSTASSFSSSYDRIVHLKRPVVKPDMSFTKYQGSHMAAKLSAFFGFRQPTDTSIEATFARGRELDKLNKLVEIEEMNEKAKNSLEVKFKKEEDDEEKDVKSQVHVEMDVLLGVLEEKKGSLGPNSAVLVGGDEAVHLRKRFEVSQVKGARYSGGMEEKQFMDWREKSSKTHGDSDRSVGRDMCKRKRGASDESEQSTTVVTKRVKMEEL